MRARFGPSATKVREYIEQDWAGEEWTRGCFMAHWAPGILTGLGPVLREPVGRIHWAGTETSAVMNGFIAASRRRQCPGRPDAGRSAPPLVGPPGVRLFRVFLTVALLAS
jgi:hypothetical protein